MTELKAPSKCGVIASLVKHEFKESCYKAAQVLRGGGNRYIDPLEWQVPKSERILKISRLASKLNNSALLNHGYRSFAFGKIMMNLAGENVDNEVFFTGAVLHDLGLMRDCTGTTFEVVGANEACGHCREDFSKKDLEIIYEMILLHDAVGRAENKSLELKYLHYGAGIDVADLWSHRINSKNYQEVFKSYPSHGHIEVMLDLMGRRLRENPKMFLSTLLKLGFEKKMRNHQSLK